MTLRSVVLIFGLLLILAGPPWPKPDRFERIGEWRVPGPVQGSGQGAPSNCRGGD